MAYTGSAKQGMHLAAKEKPIIRMEAMVSKGAAV